MFHVFPPGLHIIQNSKIPNTKHPNPPSLRPLMTSLSRKWGGESKFPNTPLLVDWTLKILEESIMTLWKKIEKCQNNYEGLNLQYEAICEKYERICGKYEGMSGKYRNLKEYGENMKEYVGNIKKIYEGIRENMKICEKYEGISPFIYSLLDFDKFWSHPLYIGSGTWKNSELQPRL